MAEETKPAKTGMTEAAIAAGAVTAFEAIQRMLTDNPIIPDPWGPLVLSGLAFGLAGLRIWYKRTQA